MSQQRVYRAASLERIASPDQLDQLLRITRPREWLGLAALGLLLAAALNWAVAGRVTSPVRGHGILRRSGGVVQVIPVSGGRVLELSVAVGGMVREGEVVARLAQPALVDRVAQARMNLENAKAEHAHVARYGRQALELQRVYLDQQAHNLEQSTAAVQRDLDALAEQASARERLAEQGLITRQAVLAARRQYDTVREKIRSDQGEVAQVAVRRLQVLNQYEKDVQSARIRVEAASTAVAQLERELREATEITSPYRGRVLEIMTEPGALVERGQSLFTLDLLGEDAKELEVVLYVSSRDGKRVAPGMEVQLAPSTVRPEEHGFMLGRVTRVSDFPATAQGMQRILKNPELVTGLSGGDAPYEVWVQLLVDRTTPSGYRWSSSRGPKVAIEGGTLCQAIIKIGAQRPIEMVLPLLRQYWGA